MKENLKYKILLPFTIVILVLFAVFFFINDSESISRSQLDFLEVLFVLLIGLVIVMSVIFLRLLNKAEHEQRLLSENMTLKVKQINSLRDASHILENTKRPSGDIIRDFLDIIPKGFQFPEICSTHLILDGKKYQKTALDSSARFISSDIIVCENKCGTLQVAYSGEAPNQVASTFLAEEETLLAALANEISRFIERHRSHEALLASEERFRSFVENANDIVYSISLEGIFTYVSPNWSDHLGHKSEEVTGQPISRFIHPSDLPVFEYYIKKVMGSFKKYSAIEYRIRHSDGSWRWHSSSTAAILDNQGKSLLFSGIARDITDQKAAESSLASSEQKFRQIFENAHDAMFILDREYIMDCNSKAVELFGYTKLQLLKMSPINLSPKIQPNKLPSEPEVLRLIDDVLCGNPQTFEWRHIKASGSCFDAEISFNVIIIDGKSRVQAIIRDITERKSTERELSRLADFPKSNPNVILTLNSQAQITYMNPGAEITLTKNGFKKSDIRKFLPDNINEILRTCIDNNTLVQNVIVKVKEIVWRWNFQSVKGQEIVHCYGHDISEKINRETELKKLSAAVSQSANLICITSSRGLIEYVNPQFCETTGYALSEVTGQPIWKLKTEVNNRAYFKELWTTVRKGKTCSGHAKVRRKDGSEYWERRTVTPIFDDSGRIMNYLSVGEDITTEIKAQQSLAQSDKLSAIGTLAAGVAHEFKNYLGGIIGNASFQLSELEDDPSLNPVRETFNQIIEMGERANEVAMSLLTYSKSVPDDIKEENLRELILKALSLVEREMYTQSIQIITYFEEVPNVRVSASKIQQLLLNLFINSRHAIKSDGVITASLIQQGDMALIKIGDTGKGIKEEHLVNIFDPFFSTKGVWGKDEIVGTGMGLSICRNIAREHDGELTVESRDSIGTTFTLALPIGSSSDEQSRVNQIDNRELRVLVFSLDKTLMSGYYQKACELKVRLSTVDDFQNLTNRLGNIADFVICDAGFAGKVELYKTAEECKELNIPYVVVNCTSMEYQMSELYDDALANFKELPDFTKIYTLMTGALNEKNRAAQLSS